MINSIVFLSEFVKFFFLPLKMFDIHNDLYVVVYAALITYAIIGFIDLINRYFIRGLL